MEATVLADFAPLALERVAVRWFQIASLCSGTILPRGPKNRDFFDRFREQADAEELPYDDASFDVVLSTFGVMFTPDQEKAAAEMARVCTQGGRIGLASWTPSGFIGELFNLLGGYLPPPAGVKSPRFAQRVAHRWFTPTHAQPF